MPTLFVCLFICHQLTGRIAHAQKLAKHMLYLCLPVALAPQMLCIPLVYNVNSLCPYLDELCTKNSYRSMYFGSVPKLHSPVF